MVTLELVKSNDESDVQLYYKFDFEEKIRFMGNSSMRLLNAYETCMSNPLLLVGKNIAN